jgi:hypothetical protein
MKYEYSGYVDEHSKCLKKDTRKKEREKSYSEMITHRE